MPSGNGRSPEPDLPGTRFPPGMETLMSALESASLARTRPFAVAERCDRCGAKAKVRAVLTNGGELLFCGHHARAHEDSLRRTAVALQSIN